MVLHVLVLWLYITYFHHYGQKQLVSMHFTNFCYQHANTWNLLEIHCSTNFGYLQNNCISIILLIYKQRQSPYETEFTFTRPICIFGDLHQTAHTQKYQCPKHDWFFFPETSMNYYLRNQVKLCITPKLAMSTPPQNIMEISWVVFT